MYDRFRKGKVMMVLGHEQYYCVSLHEEKHSIQLSFLLHGKDHAADQRFELFQYIQSKLELLMNDFMKASTKPRVYIPCYFMNCNKLHVELQLLCNGKNQHCPKVVKPVPDNYYSDLFPCTGKYYCLLSMMCLTCIFVMSVPNEARKSVTTGIMIINIYCDTYTYIYIKFYIST